VSLPPVNLWLEDPSTRNREDGLIRKAGVILDSLTAWEEHAGPMRPEQWTDHRSAKECARAWVSETDPFRIPSELLQVLATHEDFGEVLKWEAEPECLVSFDDYGGPANLDMLVTARDDRGSFVMGIEAKADESFGPLIDRALTEAVERLLENSASKGVRRIEKLTQEILGPLHKGRPRLHQIRYQLLTATAAVLTGAHEEGSDRAVLMVHEFVTPRTDARNRARNDQDLIRFLRRLGMEEPNAVLEGRLAGPIRMIGVSRVGQACDLYVGKATRTVGR
jgi:hypothetical protein